MTNKRLIFPLALLALLFVSCGKQEEGRTDEGFEPHPTWTDDSTNNFWGKQIDEELTIRI